MAVVCFRLAVMALPFIWGVASALPTGDNVEFTKIILNIDLWFWVWDILRDRIDPKRMPFPTASAPSAAPTAIGPRNITSSAGSMRARPTMLTSAMFFIASLSLL